MHISLDRNGRVVQSGEGMFRVPMGADEVDNTLSNPISQAEALAHAERVEYATMAARANDRADREQASQDRQNYLETLAQDYSEWESEEQAANNGGENPLLYLAAMQSMAGGCDELQSPISGYGLSQDGQLDYPRGMSGHVVRSFGQDLQSLIQQAQGAASRGQALYSMVTGGGGGSRAITASESVSAPVPVAAGAAAVPGASIFDQKLGGVPVTYLAGGLLLLLLLKK